ncbi:MAG TPA: toll/interleukin-1 receptor domain-containing protein [Candidatus Angelobacter sp.]|jgi:hypothetical protein
MLIRKTMRQVRQNTFLSYARADSEFVLRLVGDLKAAGANVWLDHADILPSQHWDAEIEKALTECPRLAIVLSPASVESQNVMDEDPTLLCDWKTHFGCGAPIYRYPPAMAATAMITTPAAVAQNRCRLKA